MVLSIAGRSRTGKSYLLNFFLQYLNASEEDRQNDKWLKQTDPSLGFSWRGGHKCFKVYHCFVVIPL